MIQLGIRFHKFLLIGAAGLAINMAGLWSLTEVIGLNYLVSATFAIELSLIFTFLSNEMWTWSDKRSGLVGVRFAKYHLVNGAGLGINLGILAFLVAGFGLYYMAGNLVGAGVAAIWNFGLNHVFTWANAQRSPLGQAPTGQSR